MHHGQSIAVETIDQALYSPARVLERDAKTALRTKRPYRRPRRRREERRSRFVAPIVLIDKHPKANRREAGHWEGDPIVGAFNRSAIGTLVECATRFTALVHLSGPSRAEALRDRLVEMFNSVPRELRRSLTWDEGSEIAHHHAITEATKTKVYFYHPGRPWERPSNENTNGLLPDYFPKGPDLRAYSASDLVLVADELNPRPRMTLDWQTLEQLFATLQDGHV